jgi:hypothetical protein
MSNLEDEFFSLVERPLNTKPVLVNGKEYVLHELSEGDAAEMEVAMQDKKGKYEWSRHRRVLVSYCLRDKEVIALLAIPTGSRAYQIRSSESFMRIALRCPHTTPRRLRTW